MFVPILFGSVSFFFRQPAEFVVLPVPVLFAAAVSHTDVKVVLKVVLSLDKGRIYLLWSPFLWPLSFGFGWKLKLVVRMKQLASTCGLGAL